MNTDPTSLDRLHDLVLPPALPWWPPAPGWLWILGALVLLAAVLAVRSFARWQRNHYRREALAELQRIESRIAGNEVQAAVAQLAELLKRTAITAYPREQTAALSGAAWFDFLDQRGGTQFAAGPGPLLEQVVYSGQLEGVEAGQVQELLRQCQGWIRSHVEWRAVAHGIEAERAAAMTDSTA